MFDNALEYFGINHLTTAENGSSQLKSTNSFTGSVFAFYACFSLSRKRLTSNSYILLRELKYDRTALGRLLTFPLLPYRRESRAQNRLGNLSEPSDFSPKIH
jgi:hypothetical protein